MFVSHLYVSLGEMPVQLFGPFFDWVIYFSGIELQFEINSLSIALFAIIFSNSEGCLFTLLIVSFIVQKLSSLIRSHLFIFAFISLTLGGGHRGSCCDLCRRVPMFSSRSFMVSGLSNSYARHCAHCLT